ncbi:MAG TPA: DEAD/DEAH box helicase [Spirochaetia bacterium]|nr:DEAD/DEAH box helicase [Spirochaetia bacterium]
MTASTFESLGLSEKTLALLKKKGFEEPTPIQALAIPLLLTGDRDLVARARTGTGKTAAFGLPLVERLSEPCPHVRALVLVPTRELAIQVHAEIASLRHGAHPRTVAVYGGQAISLQMRSLERGVDVVVGTPGRVIDMIQRGKLDLSKVEFLVLDEADEMLDMGFAEEINSIFEAVNPERRVLMFSATMQDAVMRVARTRLRNFTTIEDHAKAEATELTEQIWLEVRERDKMEALTRIVDMEEDFYGLVFARTRVDADRIGQALEERGYPVETLHGDYAQEHRDRVMARFRSGKVRILVATDVAARGIDVEGLTHVVNWSLPQDSQAYMHRIGRTGRAGNEGTAITFVTPFEYRKLTRMREGAGGRIKKGSVPKVSDVIDARRARAIAKVNAVAEDVGAEDSPWIALADEILTATEARVALASCLSLAFAGTLDPERYSQIADVEREERPGRLVDQTGQTRLFVSAGRRSGIDRKGLAAMIRRVSGLPDRLIEGIQVFDAFSLVTVPFDAAERIIRESRGSEGIPRMRVAKEDGGGEGGYRARPTPPRVGREARGKGPRKRT